MIANTGRTLLAILGLTTVASTALAQGNQFNPYGNSGYADYREFANPTYSNNPALPGQSILNSAPLVSRPRANSFQQYSDDVDSGDSDRPALRRGASTSVPYYQAYQRMNPEYNRVYKPNNTKEDREYNDRQKKREQDYANGMKKREQDYARAFAEKDPTKRAKLLRQIELESLDRPATSTRSGMEASKPSSNAPATTARSSAPYDRRTQAPAPLSAAETPRRSGITNTAPPAPGTSARRSRTAAPSLAAPSGSSRNRAPDPSSIPIPPPR